MITTVFSIFFIVGLGLSTGALFSASNTKHFLKNAKETVGTVERVDSHQSRNDNGGSTTMYTPVISFEDSLGKTRSFKSNVSSNSYRTNSKVDVLYNVNTPDEARIKSFSHLWLTSLILGGMGVVFTLIGGGGLFFIIRRKMIRNWVKKNGTTVRAEVTEVFRNTSISYNGRNPWAVVCTWTDFSGTTHSFQSDSLWSDPANYIKRGDQINVRLDTRRPKSFYLVDTDSVILKAS